MPDRRVQIHIIVSGHVQGVFFRYATQSVGEKLGLDGWVRNLYDGRVEAIAEGTRDELEKLLSFVKEGPQGARVENLRFEWNDHRGDPGKGFRVAPTSPAPVKDL